MSNRNLRVVSCGDPASWARARAAPINSSATAIGTTRLRRAPALDTCIPPSLRTRVRGSAPLRIIGHSAHGPPPRVRQRAVAQRPQGAPAGLREAKLEEAAAPVVG